MQENKVVVVVVVGVVVVVVVVVVFCLFWGLKSLARRFH
jgi:nitrogen fixation-related uncharacterized protein